MNTMKQIVNMIGRIILVLVQIIIVRKENSVFGHAVSEECTSAC